MACNNWLSMPYSHKPFPSLSLWTRSYAFSRSTKHTKRFLPYSHDFSKICFIVKIWFGGAANRTKTALAILQFWFHYFSAFSFKAFGIYFPWQTEECYPSEVCTLLAISFLEFQDNHTCLPISGSFAKLPCNLTHSRKPKICQWEFPTSRVWFPELAVADYF